MGRLVLSGSSQPTSQRSLVFVMFFCQSVINQYTFIK
jgi:hypothetical protein